MQLCTIHAYHAILIHAVLIKQMEISVAEPVLFWPAPAPGTFFTGSGSFSYKNRLKSSKNNVFAFTSSHRLQLRPKSTGSGSATQVQMCQKQHKYIHYKADRWENTVADLGCLAREGGTISVLYTVWIVSFPALWEKDLIFSAFKLDLQSEIIFIGLEFIHMG